MCEFETELKIDLTLTLFLELEVREEIFSQSDAEFSRLLCTFVFTTVLEKSSVPYFFFPLL